MTCSSVQLFAIALLGFLVRGLTRADGGTLGETDFFFPSLGAALSIRQHGDPRCLGVVIVLESKDNAYRC